MHDSATTVSASVGRGAALETLRPAGASIRNARGALRHALTAAIACAVAATAHGQVRTGKLGAAGPVRTPVVAKSPAAGHAPTHLLVQLAPGVTVGGGFFGEPVLRQQGRGRTATESARVLREAGVVRLTSVWVDPPRDAATARALGLDRWYRAELAPAADPLVARTRLGKLAGSLAHIGLDHEGGLAEIPNDPNFGLQYALRNTGQIVSISVVNHS